MKKSRINKISMKQLEERGTRLMLKADLIIEHGGLCMECLQRADWRGLSMHHKVSLAQGGKTERDNVILLCGTCHNYFHHIKEG